MKSLFLSNLHEHRWDWTRSAVSKFTNGFNRFDGYAEDKEQVYIGVYGPTQVGKTTFILTLLGIQFDRLSQLADALRGGREKGKSATITCTIFTKTKEANFRIIWPSGQKFTCSTLEEVEQVMLQLRKEIYGEEKFALEPLRIEIPTIHFNKEDVDNRVRDLAIIDLPGDDSKDVREMSHVNRVLKEYISRCKVCIIMEIASQMTNLTKLTKEFVRDWTVLPEQFRILLTRSVTNGSVMRQIVDDSVSTAEEFKALYWKELTRVCELDELGTAVYPLEFGDSWVDLKQMQPALFEKANQWCNTIFHELVEDLTQIDSPEQEVRKIKSMEHFIVKKQQQEVDLLVRRMGALQKKCKDGEFITSELAKKLTNDSLKVERLKKAIRFVDSYGEIEMPGIYIPDWSSLNFADKKASFLRKQFDAELESLKGKSQEFVERLNRYFLQLNRQERLNISQMFFPSELFHTRLYIDYFWDRYIKESSYRNDVFVAEQKLKIIFNEFTIQYQATIDRAKLELNKKVTLQNLICNDGKEQYIDQLKKNCLNQQEIDQLAVAIEVANKEWDEDRERSKKLNLFLMESFVEQSAVYKEVLFDPTRTKSERWLIHQYWNLLKLQAERIIDDDDY